MNKNSKTQNIFARSNDNRKEFDPQTSNTLYINSTEGVGINTNAPTATLTVNQMIQIGDDIGDDNGTCKPARQGQIIFRNGCFYACSDGQHWDNLAGTPACQ